jgi:biopolymer transport protein ExbD
MRRFSQREGLTTLSEINVTPMLDLCFVLLVIFMITTPLLDDTSDLALPTGAAANHPVDPAAVHAISIDRNQQIKLDGTDTPLEQLTGRLEALRAAKPDVAVVLRPHKELTIQQLVGVMDCVRNARISKVGIVTEQAGKP